MAVIFNASTSSSLQINSDTSGVLQLANNGTIAVTVTGGNVGIGTSSPGSQLEVSSSNTAIRVTDTSTGYAWTRYTNNSTNFFVGMDNSTGGQFGTAYARVIWGQGAYPMLFATNNTEQMRIDSSGNVGIGTTSPSYKLDVNGQARVSTGLTLSAATSSLYSTDGTLSYYSSGNGVYLNGTNSGWLALQASGSQATYIQLNGTSYSTPNIIQFITASNERMRIDSSGNLLLGTTSAIDGAYIMSVKVRNATGGIITQPGSDNYTALGFNNASGVSKGSITVSSTATAYNSASDYRLKDNIVPMTGALSRVASLKPVTYTWKADGSSAEGFIAHELAEVCPHAVTGEKDAVDADGKPIYQGIDTSFLVATLTAAIQELNTLVSAQAAQITALNAKVGITS